MTQENLYERPVDYLPERDVYESLCRGEGVKLVRPGKGWVARLGIWVLALGCSMESSTVALHFAQHLLRLGGGGSLMHRTGD